MPNYISHKPRRTASDITPQLKRAIMARDQGKCKLHYSNCTIIASEIDHITPWYLGGTLELNNLQAVCNNCHKQKTQHEAQQARKKYARKRPSKQHPAKQHTN